MSDGTKRRQGLRRRGSGQPTPNDDGAVAVSIADYQTLSKGMRHREEAEPGILALQRPGEAQPNSWVGRGFMSLEERRGPHLKVAQASLANGLPRTASPRLSVAGGREPRDALGQVILLLEGGTEQLCGAFLDTARRAYYAPETTSPISGLMRSMRVGSSAAANAARSDEEHLDIGATGLVIRGDELYIAQLLPTQVYIFRDNELNALPDDTAAPVGEPGGLPFDKDIELFRATLEVGDSIAITSSVIARTVRQREVRGLIARYDMESCVNQLSSLAAQRGVVDGDILLLRPVGAAAGDEELEPELAALPESELEPAMPMTAEAPARSRPGREPDWSSPGLEATVTVQDRARRGAGRTLLDGLIAIPLMILLLPAMAVRGLIRMLRGDGAAADRMREIDAEPPKTEYERRREAIAAGPADLEGLNRQILNPSGDVIPRSWPDAPSQRRGGLFGGIWRMSGNDDEPLMRGRRSGGGPGPGSLILMFSIVVVIAMFVVLFIRREEAPADETAVATATATPAAESQATTEKGQANAAESFARAKAFYDAALREEDDAPAKEALRDATDAANLAGRQGYAASEVNRLLAQIDDERDLLNKVTRVATSATITEFAEAGPGHAIEQLEVYQDRQYVIDAVNGQVMEFTDPKQGQTVLRVGEQVGQVGVADIVAVVARDLSLLVIDSQFNVFSVVPDQRPQHLRIVGTDQWKAPAAFDNFQNNLYVLDPVANRIHKYIPTPGGYEVEPTDFFDPTEEVDISTAVDMAIDGDVYVLLADNSILKYRGGQQMRFQIVGEDRPIQAATRIFTTADSDSLFVVDEGNRRLIEVDTRDGNEGVFLRQFLFRGADDFFAEVRGIWVQEAEGRLLVLGADSLRQFVLPRLPDE